MNKETSPKSSAMRSSSEREAFRAWARKSADSQKKIKGSGFDWGKATVEALRKHTREMK